MMAADANPWHNAVNPVDVDGNGVTSAIDALFVINELNQGGARALGNLIATAEGENPPQAAAEPMVDVNGDFFLGAIDALQVINAINAEGEHLFATVWLTPIQDVAVDFGTRTTPPNTPRPPLANNSVQAGQTFRVEVRAQDTRDDDDPDRPGVGTNFGVFAAYLDVAVDEGVFSVPSGRQPDLAGGVPVPPSYTNPNNPLPVAYRNGDYDTDPVVSPNTNLQTYIYSNGPKGNVKSGLLNGQPKTVFNDLGAFATSTSGTTGAAPLFLYDIPLKAESLAVQNDTGTVNEGGGSSIDLDILLNDKLVKGQQTITIGGPAAFPEANGLPSPGTEFLVYGKTNHGTGGTGGGRGSILFEDEIHFVNATVNVINNGTMSISGTPQASKGTVQVVNDQVSGRQKLRYTPNPTATGNDVFTYTVSDGQGNTKTATVTVSIVEINDPPVITIAQNPVNLNEGDNAVLPQGLITVSDADAGNAAIQGQVTTNVGTITLGSTTGLNITGGANNSGSITFTGTIANINAALTSSRYNPPNADFNGNALITMRADDLGNTGTDGPKTDTKTLTISFAAVNDPPVNTVPNAPANNPILVRTTENLVFSTGNNNAISVADADGNVNVRVNLTVVNGNLFVSNTGGATVAGNNSKAVTISGTVSGVNSALAGLTFNSTTLGTDTLTVLTDDLGNTGGTPQTSLKDTDTISINVIPPTTPFADNDSYTVAEESGNTTLDVLTGDISTPGGTLTITAINGTATNNGQSRTTANGGTVTHNGNTLAYRPAANFFGNDTFTYTITDSGTQNNNGPATGTVTVAVTPVNDAPTLNIPANLNKTTNEETALALTNAPITVADIDADLGGGTGVSVTVTVANGKLSPGNSGATIGGNNSASLSISGTVANVNTALAGLNYTPNLNFSGSDVLSVAVTDNGNTGGGALSASGSITLTVNPINDTPTITAPATATTNEDNALAFTNSNQVSVADVDPATGPFNVTLTLTNGGTPPGSIAVANGGATFTDNNGADGTLAFNGTLTQINAALAGLTYTPAGNFNGNASLVVNVNDNGSGGGGNAPTTASKTVAITVTPVNDPVDAVNDDLRTSNPGFEDTQLTIPISALTANDSRGPANESGQTLSVTAVNMAAAQGTVQIVGSNIVYTPATNYAGTATFTYTLMDDGTAGQPANTTDTATVTLAIAAVNDPPANTVPSFVSARENQNITFSGNNLMSVADVDSNGSDLTVMIDLNVGQLGTFSLNSAALGGLQFTRGDGTADTAMTFNGTVAEINAALSGAIFNTAANREGSGTLTIVTNDNGNTGLPPRPGQPQAGQASLTDTDVVNIVISGVNDPPVISGPTAATMNEDTGVIFTSNGGNNGLTVATPLQIADPDAGGFNIEVTLAVNAGTMALGGTNNVEIFAGANNSAAMSLRGTLSNLNAALLGLTYRAPENFNSTLNNLTPRLTMTVNDKGNTGDPPSTGPNAGRTELTDDHTVAITVTAVNDLPVLNNDTTPDQLQLVLFNTTNNPLDVLANDLQTAAQGNVDGTESFTITAATVITTTPEPGAPNAAGTVTRSNDNKRLLYTPAANFEGTEVIRYTVSDGNGGTATATASVTVVDFVPSDVTGSAYVDSNLNSRRDDGEYGIGHVRIQLTGTNVMGAQVSLVQWTDGNGRYNFEDVLPSMAGTSYEISASQPLGLVDGLETVGDEGGTSPRNDVIRIALPTFGYRDGNHAGNNFSEYGLTSSFASVAISSGNMGDLIDYGDANGVNDPVQVFEGGMLFGAKHDGTLDWYINLGGWSGYTPGNFLSADPLVYQVSVSTNSLIVSHNDTHQSEAVIVPANSGLLTQATRTAGKVYSLTGSPEDFGLAPAGDAGQFASDADDLFGSDDLGGLLG